MDLSCLVSSVQSAAGGLMVWVSLPTEYHLNTTAYLSIVADLLMANAPCHKAQLISLLITFTILNVYHSPQISYRAHLGIMW